MAAVSKTRDDVPLSVSKDTVMTLADLGFGQKGIVVGIAAADDILKRRLTAFGVIKGTEIELDRMAPMGNPRSYTILGYRLSLRNEDARTVMMRLS